MSSPVVIRINARKMQEVKSLHADNRKIAAIKLIRSSGVAYVDGAAMEKIGLREAKHALEYETRTLDPAIRPCAVLSTFPRIKKIVLDIGEDADIECDLDGLQLRLLNGLDTLPLGALGPAMDLMQYLRDFEAENHNISDKL